MTKPKIIASAAETEYYYGIQLFSDGTLVVASNPDNIIFKNYIWKIDHKVKILCYDGNMWHEIGDDDRQRNLVNQIAFYYAEQELLGE